MSDDSEADPSAEQGSGDSKKDKILAEARKRYALCCEAMDENLIAARNDLLFLQGGTNQWDSEAVLMRTAQRRPMITINQLPTFLHQVTNDQRMNTPAIKVHPVDDGADIETAKILQGLIRHIEYDSNADVAYDTAVNSAAAIGFGYFRLVTEYVAEDSRDQCIKYKRIRNALSVKIDPLAVEPDGSDMKYCFIECLMNKNEFKRAYPDAKFETQGFFNDGTTDPAWIDEETILLCEYYCIEKEKDTYIELDDGTSGFKSKILDMGEAKEVFSRPTTRSKVMWYKITGADVLEEAEIKCKWIPVFPVYGDEIDIAGKVTRAGIVRNAKGPAQMYNVMMTSAVEEVALRSKSPYIMAEGQEVGHQDEWQQANNTPLSYLLYKPTSYDGHLVPAPQRNPMADVPTGMLALAMHANDNVKKTTGLFDASLGNRGTATSGRQEIAQQREGDVANYHYADGLLRTLRHCGRCEINMIPHYYDGQRTVRILGEDDTAEYKTINQQQINPLTMQVEKVLHDVTVGTYDITVTSGPSYTTMRQESAEFFTNAMQAAKDPATAAVVSYLAMKNQDVPGGDIATKMMETLLPAPAQAVIKQEMGGEEQQEEMIPTPHGPLPVSQVPQALQQMGMQIQQLNEALQKAQADKQQSEVLKQQNQQQANQLDLARVETEHYNAETARFKAQGEAAKAEDERAKTEAELLLAHQKLQIDAKSAEQAAINGDTTAFEAWKATLESETRIRVAEIMAHSADRRALIGAQAKKQPTVN